MLTANIQVSINTDSMWFNLLQLIDNSVQLRWTAITSFQRGVTLLFIKPCPYLKLLNNMPASSTHKIDNKKALHMKSTVTITAVIYKLTSSNCRARLYKEEPLVSNTWSCFRINKNIICIHPCNKFTRLHSHHYDYHYQLPHNWQDNTSIIIRLQSSEHQIKHSNLQIHIKKA